MEPTAPQINQQVSSDHPRVLHPIDWRLQSQQYGTALLVAAPLFTVLSIYLFYRRGYYDLFIANKIFAGVAAVMLGIVLIIGPLSRLFNKFDHYLQYRKELGIIAFLLAFVHAIASLFLLPTHFPLIRYVTTGLWPFVFGLASLFVLLFILIISNAWGRRALGGARWWRIQNWGVRIAFVLLALHVGIMKFPSWVSWYQEGGSQDLVHPEWPGAGMLIAWLMAFVILFRLMEYMNPALGKIGWYMIVIGLPVVYVFTFLWGSRFA